MISEEEKRERDGCFINGTSPRIGASSESRNGRSREFGSRNRPEKLTVPGAGLSAFAAFWRLRKLHQRFRTSNQSLKNILLIDFSL